MLYFDFNATTPLQASAREAWLKANEARWFNASSLYHGAGFTAHALSAARERLAELLGCEAERLVFTSGATESNNALFASLARTLPTQASVAISAIEHPSVREAARSWLGRARVLEIPVNGQGIVEPEAVKHCFEQHRPSLVSVMSANNESGTLQPWADIAALCAEHEVPYHCDAAQWLGKEPASGLGTAASYLTGSAHKFGGPKGVGFLLLSDPDESFTWLRGGPQEEGRRAGTENYPGIESMVTALESLEPRLVALQTEQAAQRDAFTATLHAALPGLRVIGDAAPRLWNTVLMVMPRHDNLKWLTRLSRQGVSLSTGSACSSGKEGSSVVVQALGATPAELRRVLRVSGGWDTSAEDWQALASLMIEVGITLDAGGLGG